MLLLLLLLIIMILIHIIIINITIIIIAIIIIIPLLLLIIIIVAIIVIITGRRSRRGRDRLRQTRELTKQVADSCPDVEVIRPTKGTRAGKQYLWTSTSTLKRTQSFLFVASTLR